MSTVVGTCTDCIVSLPTQPLTSLKFKIVAQQGMGGIIRTLGTYNAYYPAANISSEQLIVLAESGTFAPVLPSALKALSVYVTGGPVTVALTNGEVVSTLTVNTILIVDDAYTAVAITNPSTTASVQVQLNYCM
jgi:hypothetical protein